MASRPSFSSSRASICAHCFKRLHHSRSIQPRALSWRDSARSQHLLAANAASNVGSYRPTLPRYQESPQRERVRQYTLTSARLSAPETLPVEADLSIESYHKLSDVYLHGLVAELEALAEEDTDYDVEYSNGVLTLSIEGKGTYVVNKQPPNRQIWLSSPLSGPKRYDYVDGKWLYGRDQSDLSDLLREEIGVEIKDEDGSEVD